MYAWLGARLALASPELLLAPCLFTAFVYPLAGLRAAAANVLVFIAVSASRRL